MERLTFAYDEESDTLQIGGVIYSRGAYRALGGRLNVGGSTMVVEARGGGVFHVAVPESLPRAASASGWVEPALAPAPPEPKKRK